jgi:Flp pilus assembly protein TadD
VVGLWIEAGESWRLPQLAADLVANRRLADAEAVYREMLRYHPRDADVLGELGVLVLRRRGSLEEAVSLLEQSAQIEPKKREPLAEYLLGRGVDRRNAARRAATTYDDSLSWLRAAAALNPDDADAHLELGLALAWSDQPEEARVELQRALALRPDSKSARAALDELGT